MKKLATKNVTQNVAFENGKKNSSRWTYLDSQRRVQCSTKSRHRGKSSTEDRGGFAWLQRPGQTEQELCKKGLNNKWGRKKEGKRHLSNQPPITTKLPSPSRKTWGSPSKHSQVHQFSSVLATKPGNHLSHNQRWRFQPTLKLMSASMVVKRIMYY